MISAIFFDFDGVLTDDKVYLDQDGRESVCCSRRDGLGFDILRKTQIKLFILSGEINPVVAKRGEKLKVRVIQGVSNKAQVLQDMACSEEIDLETTLYIGNDINDLSAIRLCGQSACPSDAHLLVKSAVKYVLETAGGQGVTREIIEKILCIDSVKTWSSVV